MLYLGHFLCFSLLFFLGFFCFQVSSLEFSFPVFKKDDGEKLIYVITPSISSGAVRIASESNSHENSSIRILYKEPLSLCTNGRAAAVSFNSSFVFRIGHWLEDEGLAFILANTQTVPSNSHGQRLVIFNKSTNGLVHVNCMNSIREISLAQHGVNLSSGVDVIAHVQYNGIMKIMTVDVAMANNPSPIRSDPLVHFSVDLSVYLQEKVYVGFSASIGDPTHVTYIKSWNFTSRDVGRRSHAPAIFISSHARAIFISISISLIIFLSIGFLCCLQWRRTVRISSQRSENLDLESILVNSTIGPHKFGLKELKCATTNFDPSNKVGQGGFGTVYRGLLKNINKEVAIKRLAKNSRQGRQQFIAELTTFKRIQHKNLVKLIGWCHEEDELLLVYELLPKGSLDKLIFWNESSTSSARNEEVTLSWGKRHSIICGVASALCYLHYGCEMRVLHRDVKASNVMIDSDYNARLGDFGLARTIQPNGESSHSTHAVAGTPGYIAPECFLTGRATVEADVYGFGVLILEVACGRRPHDCRVNSRVIAIKNHHDDSSSESTRGSGSHDNNIVDWVWALYGKQRVLEAVDPRLHGEFDEEQMSGVLRLGLACCHPDPNERPTMSIALQVLTGEAAPPFPPMDKPHLTWPLITTFSSDVHSFCSSFSGR